MKKKICEVFSNNGLKVKIEVNKKTVNFLDLTLDLKTNKFSPYMKDNSNLTYVHAESNHPPHVLKAIPKGVNARLCSISSDAEVFKRAAPPYQEALKKSGFNHVMEYSKPTGTRTRRRKRNITWFNPPYDVNVEFNLGQKFLLIIDTCFPKENKMHQLFNRSTVKLSYSCMPNVGKIITGHNKKVLNQANTDDDKTCNCRSKNNCPLNGACQQKSVIYQATVADEKNHTETYVGLTEGEFKTRWNGHNHTFRNEKRDNATELSKHIWQLKRSKTDYQLSWKILARATPYSNKTKRCNLCTTEKFYIIYHPELASLNKRSELISCCRHSAKFLLENT